MNSFQSKYHVINKIGEGTFSDVIKCIKKTTGDEYAAKRLKKICRSPENVEKCAEVIAWRNVSYHNNILNMIEYYYDYFTGQVVFIFQMMDMSLYEYITHKKYPLSEDKAKSFVYQIICGINHLHKSGFFHRDIKPENILIQFTNKGENVKVGDFGSIRGIYSSHPYTEYISTRWYRSPECLLTIGHYSSKMDIWAIGCVFYELLTFKPLFPGVNEIDQLAKIHKIIGVPSRNVLNKLQPKSKNAIQFPYTSGIGLQVLLPKVSRECRSIILQMLEYDPVKRINAKRLLKKAYFLSLKYNESEKHKKSDEKIINEKTTRALKSPKRKTKSPLPQATHPRSKSTGIPQNTRSTVKQKSRRRVSPRKQNTSKSVRTSQFQHSGRMHHRLNVIVGLMTLRRSNIRSKKT
ncbi:MAPK/MAK/MRK overlapping kinase isoform X2 [Aethina tumida]|uniref:MAPK/MAK/MRK overlapping kinase isoform X2 n=1 Tax=Aethina tumida TaxID=116153 RepID=UPI002147D9D4|nr:MAPK/MAK/MRK overlapping kinase isoform X2 [Aethina tumida]